MVITLFLIAQILYFPHDVQAAPTCSSDMTIAATSTAGVGGSFIISGTSRMAAAERVNLYIVDNKEPVSYTVVGLKPPFAYEFEVLPSNDSLTINGMVFDSGPTAGKTFYFYLESNNQEFISSSIISITINK